MFDTYEEDVVLYTSSCDRKGKWKLSALIEVVENVAHKHLERNGCDSTDIRTVGFTWLLLKTYVEFQRYPVIGEKIKVTTFIKKPCLKYTTLLYINR